MELVLTTPLPDELLASYLSRLAKINGFRDQRNIWNELNGRSDCTSFIDAEVSFPTIAEVMKSCVGTSEGLVKNCTFIPGQVLLGEVSDKELLSIVVADRMLTLSQLTFLGPAALKYCERCVHEDLATYNVSYWHRVHQVPMVKACPIHRVLLTCVQFKRADLHYKFPMPNEVSSKRTKTQDSAMSAPMLAVADIAASLLAAPEERMKTELRAVIWEELGNCGHLQRDGILQRKKLVADLSSQLSKYFSPTSAEMVELKRIVVWYGNPRSPRAPLGGVFLIYFLFGSWGRLLEQSRWMSTFGSQYVCSFGKKETSPREIDPGCTYLNDCLDFVAQFPQGTRFEFKRKYYRAFWWLSRYNSALLDRLLPISDRRAKQFELFCRKRRLGEVQFSAETGGVHA